MTPAVSDAANYDDVEISPDDSRAMVSVRDGDGRDLWIVDLTRGVRRRFTSGPERSRTPSGPPTNRCSCSASAARDFPAAR